MKRRTRNGFRFRVRCPVCKRKTHLHRPNGGDLYEWEQMNK